jgi:hypothetical protein
LLGGGGLSFLAGVKRQRCGWLVQRGVRHWRPSAKENEHREARSLERLKDIGISRRKKLDFLRISCQGQGAEFSQEARDTFERGELYQGVIGLSSVFVLAGGSLPVNQEVSWRVSDH